MSTPIFTDIDISNFIQHILGPQVKFILIEETKSELNQLVVDFVAKTNVKIESIKTNEFHVKCFSMFSNKYFINMVAPYIKIEEPVNAD